MTLTTDLMCRKPRKNRRSGKQHSIDQNQQPRNIFLGKKEVSHRQTIYNKTITHTNKYVYYISIATFIAILITIGTYKYAL